MTNILTCVYCGMAYPEGTPPHSAKILTDHIKVCNKHPMRKAEVVIVKLRNALSGLIGASTVQELSIMEANLRFMPGIESDKIAAINAINVLIETADSETT